MWTNDTALTTALLLDRRARLSTSRRPSWRARPHDGAPSSVREPAARDEDAVTLPTDVASDRRQPALSGRS